MSLHGTQDKIKKSLLLRCVIRSYLKFITFMTSQEIITSRMDKKPICEIIAHHLKRLCKVLSVRVHNI